MKNQNNNITNQIDAPETPSFIKQKFDTAVNKLKAFVKANFAIMLLLAVIAINALLISVVPGLMITKFGSVLGFMNLGVILVSIMLLKTK